MNSEFIRKVNNSPSYIEPIRILVEILIERELNEVVMEADFFSFVDKDVDYAAL